MPADDRRAAFTPEPTILPVNEILFDAGALTSIKTLPGRPPVVDWVHGLAEWDPPQTYIAWREEVELATGELLELNQPEELLEDYPLKPHEQLRDTTYRVFKELQILSNRNPALPVWIIEERDMVRVTTLANLVEIGENAIANKVVLLPPSAGGLKAGLLDGKAEFIEDARDQYDVADQWPDSDGHFRRRRVWDDDETPDGMRLIRTIDIRPDADELDEDQIAARRNWCWYVRPRSADDDGSRSAQQPQLLQPHLRCAEDFAQALVEKLGMPEPIAAAVRLAAKWHNLGKDRKVWQYSVNNREYPDRVLAKSDGRMRPLDLSGYRHEFGSLIDVKECPEFQALNENTQDLVAHLIAAHHGHARPHFPVKAAFDPERRAEQVTAVACETPQRFARLQRKYGRWGLAYLESLLRAADFLASQANDRQEIEKPALAPKGPR